MSTKLSSGKLQGRQNMAVVLLDRICNIEEFNAIRPKLPDKFIPAKSKTILDYFSAIYGRFF